MAGASGFVGTSLRTALSDKYNWIGLTRSESVVESSSHNADHTTWRHCDLFSLPQVREALKGAEVAIYMVHSMLPSSRLVQGNFRDMDLLLADNFVRGAEEAGVKRVIYLGGLIPQGVDEDQLSPHLASRLEVERALSRRSIPVTVLRAGLIFGPGGSSARMLLNLTRRLPVMVLPAWTRNQTNSIDVKDVIRAMDMALECEDCVGSYDIAGHPAMSYKEMILRTSELLGRTTLKIELPGNFFLLSRRWVSVFGSTPAYLVNPLLESLRHNLTARPNRLLEKLQADAVPFDQSVRGSVDEKGFPLPNPRQKTQKRDLDRMHQAKRVRSIQRMPLPRDWSAIKLSDTYAWWISHASMSLIKEHRSPEGVLSLRFLSSRIPLLELTPTPYSINCQYRRAYYVTGGLLVRKVDPPGRFELRVFPELNCLIAAIHGYTPKLPWWLYSISQALVHLAVMKAFGRYLQRVSMTENPSPQGSSLSR